MKKLKCENAEKNNVGVTAPVYWQFARDVHFF